MADNERDYVERDADLFQAGAYPDRNLTVTQADIARLAATSSPIPINVEHAGGPVQLGEVTGLQAAGDWLKGKLRLFPEANALLERLGVKSLSVGISRALDRVHEVSVTGTPRVAGARMFSGESELVVFSLGERPTGGHNMPEDGTPAAVTQEQFSAMQALFAELQTKLAAESVARAAAEAQAADAVEKANAVSFAIRVKEATTRVDDLQRAGKLPPVVREEAVALLLSGGTVKFSGKDSSAAEVFAAFLDKLPAQFGKPLKGEVELTIADLSLNEEQQKVLAAYSDLDKKALAANLAVTFGRGA